MHVMSLSLIPKPLGGHPHDSIFFSLRSDFCGRRESACGKRQTMCFLHQMAQRHHGARSLDIMVGYEVRFLSVYPDRYRFPACLVFDHARKCDFAERRFGVFRSSAFAIPTIKQASIVWFFMYIFEGIIGWSRTDTCCGRRHADGTLISASWT